MPNPWTYKAEWIFEGKGHGWSESVFFQLPTDNLQTAAAQVDSIVGSRKQMLGTEYELKATITKIVLDDGTPGKVVKGASRVSIVNAKSTHSPAEPGAAYNLSLLCSFENATTRKNRLYYLGGIWDSAEKEGGKYSRDPLFVGYFNSWKIAMLSQLGTQVSTPAGPTGVGWLTGTRSDRVNISAAVADVADYWTLTSPSPLFAPFITVDNPTPNLTIRIDHFAGPNKSVMNGPQVVQVISSFSCKLVKPLAALPYAGLVGRMSTYGYTFELSPFLNAEEIRSRQRGRPLLVSVGRRANRART